LGQHTWSSGHRNKKKCQESILTKSTRRPHEMFPSRIVSDKKIKNGKNSRNRDKPRGYPLSFSIGSGQERGPRFICFSSLLKRQ
jgi:hypothetical protein